MSKIDVARIYDEAIENGLSIVEKFVKELEKYVEGL